MAEFDGDVLAVADTYAQALLDLAREQGQEEQVAAELDELVAFMDREPAFDAFLTAATIGNDPRRVSLEKLFRGRMNDLLLNTLQVLNNRFRTDLARAMRRCVELRLEQQHHQQEVRVTTATPLTEKLRAEIKDVVSGWIGKEPILIEKVEPELIGGIVVRAGDIQMDGSVAFRMTAMRKRLRGRTTQEIHRSRQYVEQ